MRVNLSKYNYIDISKEALKMPKDKFMKVMLSYHSNLFKSPEEAEKAFSDVWAAANPGKKSKKEEV